MSFLTKALYGLASIYVKRGLRFQDALDPLKQAFVKAAQNELLKLDQPINTSRLAAMTGLQRRDIDRLLKGEEPGTEAISFFTKLINAWNSDKRFSAKGKPKTLNCEGANSEFAELVASVSKDINSYTALFELERLKVIKRDGANISLIFDAFVTTEDQEQSFLLLSDDLKDLTLAVDENINNENIVPNLHISTRYDNLALSKLEEIREWLLREGAAFHAKARDYLQQYDKDLNPDLKNEKGGGKATLGPFSLISKGKQK